MNYSPTLVFEDSTYNNNVYEDSLDFGLMQMSKV